jgi:hypothetical protein
MSRKSEMKAAKKAAYEAQGLKTTRPLAVGRARTLVLFGAHFNSEDCTLGAGWGFDLPCLDAGARALANDLLNGAVACHERGMKAYKSQAEYSDLLLQQTKEIAVYLDLKHPRDGAVRLDLSDEDTLTHLVVFVCNVYALQTMGVIPIDNGNGLNLAYMSQSKAA